MISASRAAARLPLLLPRGGPVPAVPGLAQVRVGPEGAGRERCGLGGGGPRGGTAGVRWWTAGLGGVLRQTVTSSNFCLACI